MDDFGEQLLSYYYRGMRDEQIGSTTTLPPDDELLQMVKAIINHEDENELIDYIDDVYVWEKVEFSFSVGDFCVEVGYTGKEFKN